MPVLATVLFTKEKKKQEDWAGLLRDTSWSGRR